MRKERFLITLLSAGLFYSASDVLADWSPAKRLTWNSGYSSEPAIAIDSSKMIHFVWRDDTSSKDEIYYKRSPDGGTTWSPSKRLTWTPNWSYYPAIAVDLSSSIHVVWQEYTPGDFEIYYKRSTDKGTSWSAAKRLTWNSAASSNPAIAVDISNTIHVVWSDYTPGNSEIYHKKSTDGGTTWSAATRLTSTLDESSYPDIAIDSSGTIHVVWYDYTPKNYEIYYIQSTDGGTTWSAVQRLTWTAGWSFYPAIAIDSDNAIHVVWQDNTPGNYEVYYKRSTDGGATWSAAKRLTWTSAEPTFPHIAIAIDSSKTIHVVWDDYAPGNFEVYCMKGTNGGTTWSAVNRLSWTGGASNSPTMAIDSDNNIHILWGDNSPGNYEIYYRKGN